MWNVAISFQAKPCTGQPDSFIYTSQLHNAKLWSLQALINFEKNGPFTCGKTL